MRYENISRFVWCQLVATPFPTLLFQTEPEQPCKSSPRIESLFQKKGIKFSKRCKWAIW
jgi:hypothetical protein